MKSVVNCGPNKINQKHCQHLDCTVATYCVRVPLIILFEKQNTLFSVETFITAYHLRGYSIPDSLNLEKNSGENSQFCPHTGLSCPNCFRACMPLSSRTSPAAIYFLKLQLKSLRNPLIFKGTLMQI